MSIINTSEQYRKYLLAVKFAGRTYYTVFGSDLSDNEFDKLLVNEENKLLLFLTTDDLLETILSVDSSLIARYCILGPGKLPVLKRPMLL